MNDIKTPREVERAVAWAYGLLVASSALTLLQFPLDPRMSKISGAFPILFALLLLVGGFTWFLIAQIKNQRNWARITMLVIFCISVPGMVKSIIEVFKVVPFFGCTSLLLLAGEIHCLRLLFGASANRWFSERPPEEKAAGGSFLEEEARLRTAGIYEKEKWRNR
jgi:hypothetical protein